LPVLLLWMRNADVRLSIVITKNLNVLTLQILLFPMISFRCFRRQIFCPFHSFDSEPGC
jgi:hypothetical protein